MLNFFGGKKEQDTNSFKIELKEFNQWEELKETSYKKTVYLFKHSTRCGISSIVLHKFEKKMKEMQQEFFYLNILNYRQLSNAIAHDVKVHHESPQLIVMYKGEVVKHNSHFGLLDLL